MKRTYIKPVVEEIKMGSELLRIPISAVRMTGNKMTNTVVINENRLNETIERDDPNGEEAGSKFHHNWSVWDDE